MFDRARFKLHRAFKQALAPLRRRFPTLVYRFDDPRRRVELCASCGRIVFGMIYHLGFSDDIALYCSQCESVLLLDVYHPALADLRAWAIEHNTGFGAAPAAYWASFESRFKPCGCGGHFSDINPPRCPHCRGSLHSESNTEAAAIYTRGPYAFVPGPTYDGAQHQKGAG